MPTTARNMGTRQAAAGAERPVLSLAGQEIGVSLPGAILPLLREAIIAGQFPPGSRLSELSLARDLKTSRTPVREALARLEHEQLVMIVPHVGTCVRPITKTDVEEIYQLRTALECLASGLAVERLTPVGELNLRQAVDEVRESARLQDLDRYARARDAFHDLIIRLSGNGRLEEVYNSLSGPIRRLRRLMQKYSADAVMVRSNISIGEAILARDARTAEITRAHLEKARVKILKSLDMIESE